MKPLSFGVAYRHVHFPSRAVEPRTTRKPASERTPGLQKAAREGPQSARGDLQNRGNERLESANSGVSSNYVGGRPNAPVGGDISLSMRDGCSSQNIKVSGRSNLRMRLERGKGSRRLYVGKARCRPDAPSALERSNCGGRSISRLERADQGCGSLIGPMDFANAARSPAGAFGVTDLAPSGSFLDACTCWKTRLAMNCRNGV
jgi:hypothetical protein